jgi:putative transposase
MDLKPVLKLNSFPPETNLLIDNIRNSQPARKVKSRANNVPGFYTSKKMGVTIQFESHKLELAAIYEKEFDENVLEYYDQPPSFKISYYKNEKKIGHMYTADFFVIEKDWVGWEEWKMEDELVQLNKKTPERYLQDENGVWKCPPAENYANQYGLGFRIRTSKELNWVLQKNLRFLEDYLVADNLKIKEETKELIITLVQDKPGIHLMDLLNRQSKILSADDIYTMIATNCIYGLLEKYYIKDFDNFPLFIDKNTADLYQNATNAFYTDNTSCNMSPIFFELQVGINIQWGTTLWKIINVDEQRVWLCNTNDETTSLPIESFENLIQEGSIKSLETANKKSKNEKEDLVIEIFNKTSPEQLQDANKKYLIVKQILEGTKVNEINVPDRTIRDWVRKYKTSEKKYGNGFIGLIRQTHKQGNRKRKISEEVLNLIHKIIVEDYESMKQKNVISSYRKLRSKCVEYGLDPISYKTFINEVKNRPIHEQTEKRKGSKAAYFSEVKYVELTQTTPRHGERPFEICHMDHTELDIELICSLTGENLGRPWVTFLVDAFTRKVLSFYLTYDSPSYRSCMMTLRECVRKHKRFPKMIVVDGGKEFHSVYFDTLLSFNNAGKKVRPGGKPRYGSVCERIFGTTNTMFINNLIGNTQITKHVRQVTESVNPKNNAVWTLEMLYEILGEWLYEVYDQKIHSSLNESPRTAFVRSQKFFGVRSHTFVAYNDLFIMLTLPSTSKGTAKYQPGNGLKINRFYYWSDSLLSYPELENNQIPIRYHPYNIGYAYAFVNKTWITLTSEYFHEMVGKTEKQLKIIIAEIRKRNKLSNNEKEITTKEIVDFFDRVEGVEAIRIQELKDRASKNLIDSGTSQNEKNNSKNQNEVFPNVVSFQAAIDRPDKSDRKNQKDKNNKMNDFFLYEEF